MEIFSSGAEIYSRVFQKSRETLECSKDFILPDFYADIKRIISCRGSISPENCFIEGTKASVNGTLTSKVIFLDDEGKLRSVSFTQDYSASVPVGESDTYGEISVISLPTLENISVKILNPRKVGVRGRIDTGIKAWKKIPVEPEISGDPETDALPELKKEKVTYMCPLSLWERDLELSADLIFDKKAQEIISSDVKLDVLECEISENTVSVKGNALIEIIYTASETGETVYMNRAIPFENTLEGDFSLLENAVCVANAYLRSLDSEISEDGNKLEIDINYIIAVNGAGNASCEYVSDMYLPAYALETESEKINFSNEPHKTVKVVRLEGCSDGELPEGSNVFFVTVVPSVETLTNENGVKSVVGTSYITVAYRDPDGNISSRNFSSDFNFELRDLPDFDEYVFLIRVSSLNVRSEENRLCVGYDLEVTILSWQSESSEMIKSAQVTEDNTREEGKPFTVYYPTKEETVWDIGKKYNISAKDLVSANPEIKNSSEKAPSVWLIPRHKIKKRNI